MRDNDKQLIFCKGCHKFKPTKGAIWDLIFKGFVCKDCYNKLLKTFDKGDKQ